MNPYETPGDSIAAQKQAWIRAIVSAIATLVAIPISYIAILSIERFFGSDINNPSVVIYMLILAVVALPVAVINSMVVAPLFQKYTNSTKRILNGIAGVSVLLLFWTLFILLFPDFINFVSPNFDTWLPFYNFTYFLGLPMILGILVDTVFKWLNPYGGSTGG